MVSQELFDRPLGFQLIWLRTYNDFTNDCHLIRTWILEIYLDVGHNAHGARAKEQAIGSISLTIHVESYFTLATERRVLQGGSEHKGLIHESPCGSLQLISSRHCRQAVDSRIE